MKTDLSSKCRYLIHHTGLIIYTKSQKFREPMLTWERHCSFPTKRHSKFISATSTSLVRRKSIIKSTMLVLFRNLILISIHGGKITLATLPLIGIFGRRGCGRGWFPFPIGVGSGGVTWARATSKRAVAWSVGVGCSLDTRTDGRGSVRRK